MVEDTTVIPPNTDLFTRFDTAISGDHRYIHMGKAFTVSGRIASIAAGATYIFEFVTPSGNTFVHWRPAALYSSANVIEGRLAEASTSSAGSVLTPYCRRRTGTPPVATTAVKGGVTMGTEGTLLCYTMAGSSGSGAASRTGGQAGQDDEIVLKQNTKYTYRIENFGATTATSLVYEFFWYEEEMG